VVVGVVNMVSKAVALQPRSSARADRALASHRGKHSASARQYRCVTRLVSRLAHVDSLALLDGSPPNQAPVPAQRGGCECACTVEGRSVRDEIKKARDQQRMER
jgi:hypothetical protein